MNLAINSFVSWRTTFLGIAGVVAIVALEASLLMQAG